MLDTLRTAGAGVAATWINCFQLLPEVVSVAVGIATLVYLIIKIRKEL
tara:strand:+ start:5965 stop:6108 length:144 start_codon:yes stop_codon:yes gene_type:complete